MKKMKLKKMEQIIQININKISPNSLQPRKEFEKEKIIDLANSIKQVGLINPIQVKKISDSDDKYEIICGERRFRAYKFLKLKTINAIVKTYEKGKEKNEMVESLVENLQRTNLTSIERENYISTLWELKKWESHKKLGNAIGLSKGYVSHNLLAKKMRYRLNISKSISTRFLIDIQKLNDEDKFEVIKKVEKNEVNTKDIRDYTTTLNKLDNKTKKSLFKNEISINQAKQISKIENPKIKNEIIKAHKEINKIDKSIDKQVLEKVKNKKETNLIKTKELLSTFRSNCIELQNKNQVTIKSFLNCVPYIDLMDLNEIDKLKYDNELLKNNFTNALEVLEKLDERIKL